jgi:hypothetical protein
MHALITPSWVQPHHSSLRSHIPLLKKNHPLRLGLVLPLNLRERFLALTQRQEPTVSYGIDESTYNLRRPLGFSSYAY